MKSIGLCEYIFIDAMMFYVVFFHGKSNKEIVNHVSFVFVAPYVKHRVYILFSVFFCPLCMIDYWKFSISHTYIGYTFYICVIHAHFERFDL